MVFPEQGAVESVHEEVINGLVVRQHEEEALYGGRGSLWLTEYQANGSHFDVIHTDVSAADPVIGEDSHNVFLSWNSRTVPGQLLQIALNTTAPRKWIFDGQAQHRHRSQFVYDNISAGDIRLTARFSRTNQAEVELRFPLHTTGITNLAEMIIDRTIDYELIPHLPLIIERERDLLA